MRQFLQRLVGKQSQRDEAIIVVSGLPRSGTSMMMKMLEAGGIPPLTDALRTADADNPKGYYEFERVKALEKGDYGWLPEARGKAVKVISALLKYLPQEYQYKVVFMRRNIDEILASQRKMLVHRGEGNDKVSDDALARLYEKHLTQVYDWMATQPNIALASVNYNTLLASPAEEISLLQEFLGGPLNAAMIAQVIDGRLYRNRVLTLSQET